MIIFLYGEDTFRSRKKLKQLKEKFQREVDNIGGALVTINGEKTNLSEINEASAIDSLFARKRMIIVEKIFTQKSKEIFTQLGVYLKKNFIPSSTGEIVNKNILVFWDDLPATQLKSNKLFKLLLKSPYAQEFKPLNNKEIVDWIKKTVSERNGKITVAATANLATLFNNNLWQLNNEINKLLNYKRGQEKQSMDTLVNIEIEDVFVLARGQEDANIFALTDAISNKNKILALKLLDKEIRAGLTEAYLFAMLFRQFRILLQIRQCLDDGYSSRKIINILHLHPFVAQKGMSQARHFTLLNLKELFKKLVNMDQEIKTGKINPLVALTLFLAKV